MPLVTLTEAKQQLDIDTTAHDIELQLYVNSLDSVIEGYVGVVEQREITDVITGGGPALSVLHPPLWSVASLTGGAPGGSTSYTPDSLTVTPAGIIGLLDGGAFPIGSYTVTYTAGRAAIPPTIKLAALILLQHLWRTQYGASRVPVGGADDWSVTDPIPGFGYAVPNRVLQLLEPFKLPPGVA